MALTPAEKMKRRRQKLKDEGKYKEFQKAHNATAKKSREKIKARQERLPLAELRKLKKEQKEKCRERVARQRMLKKQHKQNAATPIPDTPVYKNNSSLGKAVARVKRWLPQSPRHKRALVRKLYVTEIGQVPTVDDSPARPKTQLALSADAMEEIKKFYERDDISRQAPGRKDVVTIRDGTGSKTKVQARHLIYTIREAHGIFCREHENVKLGKSKFATLRPKYVLCSNKLPHYVCLCRYHENYISAVSVLHKILPNNYPLYSQTYPETLLCEPPRDNCWMSVCEACKGKFGEKFEKVMEDENLEVPCTVSWNIWKDNSEGRLIKSVEEGTVNELGNYIMANTPSFLEHCYVKREQAKMYRGQRESVGSPLHKTRYALIQVDFSENYTCVQQDEIQSAHWNQSQVSLFTAAVWCTGDLHSHVVASDNLDHSKETAISYMDKLLEELPDEVCEVDVWSDGPSSQFKNRFIAATLGPLQKRHRLTIRWNYFATSHGKGPVDGIGGSVKRQVWMGAKSRKFTVTNAAEFVVAAKKLSTVNVVEVNSKEMDKRNLSIKTDEIFKIAAPIIGIKRFHFLECSAKNQTRGRLLTRIQVDEGSPTHNAPSVEDKISVGSWCIVEYDTNTYRGEVTAIVEEEFKVSVMMKSGQYWKWPEIRDEIFYTRDKLIKKILPPTVVNSRGFFKFNE